MNDSAIMCDEIIEETKTVLTNFNEAKSRLKNTKFLYFAFLLIAIALLISVSIYYYLIKYQAKQKHYCFSTQITN